MPMLPPTSGRKSTRSDNFTRQRRGRRLAVGTGDGHDVPGQETGRQFDFANHRFAQSTSLNQRRRIHGNAGTDHDQVLSAKCALAMAASLDRDAMIEQEREFPCRVGLAAWRRKRLRVRHAPFKNNADATPDLPRPTTSTRLFAVP